MPFGVHMCTFLMSIHLGAELLGHQICTCSAPWCFINFWVSWQHLELERFSIKIRITSVKMLQQWPHIPPSWVGGWAPNFAATPISLPRIIRLALGGTLTLELSVANDSSVLLLPVHNENYCATLLSPMRSCWMTPLAQGLWSGHSSAVCGLGL